MSRKKLVYGDVPNMTGLFIDAGMPLPEAPKWPLKARSEGAQPAEPMPQPAPIRPQEEHASEPLPAAKVPATSAPALPSVSQTPRTKKAPRRPPAHKATTALKREESGRVRRTMRFPAALDAMLCELARSQGVTLNAAVALAIQAEWQRIRGTRSGA